MQLNDNYQSPDADSKKLATIHVKPRKNEIDICKQAFLDFFTEVLNKFWPDEAEGLNMLDMTEFIDEWVDLHFEEN